MIESCTSNCWASWDYAILCAELYIWFNVLLPTDGVQTKGATTFARLEREGQPPGILFSQQSRPVSFFSCTVYWTAVHNCLLKEQRNLASTARATVNMHESILNALFFTHEESSEAKAAPFVETVKNQWRKRSFGHRFLSIPLEEGRGLQLLMWCALLSTRVQVVVSSVNVRFRENEQIVVTATGLLVTEHQRITTLLMGLDGCKGSDHFSKWKLGIGRIGRTKVKQSVRSLWKRNTRERCQFSSIWWLGFWKLHGIQRKMVARPPWQDYRVSYLAWSYWYQMI